MITGHSESSRELTSDAPQIRGGHRVPGPIGKGMEQTVWPASAAEPGLDGAASKTKLTVEVRWSDTNEYAVAARVSVLGPEVPGKQRYRSPVKTTGADGRVTFDEENEGIKAGVQYIVLADAERQLTAGTHALTVCLSWRQTGNPTGNAYVSLQGPNGESPYKTNNAGSCVTFTGLKPGKWIYKGHAQQPDGLMQSPTEQNFIILPAVFAQTWHGEDGPNNTKSPLSVGLQAGQETIDPIALRQPDGNGQTFSGSLHVNIGGSKKIKDVFSVHVIHYPKPTTQSIKKSREEIMMGGAGEAYAVRNAQREQWPKDAEKLLIREINKKKPEIRAKYASADVKFFEQKPTWYWLVDEFDHAGEAYTDDDQQPPEHGRIWKWTLQVRIDADVKYEVTESTDE